MSTQLYQDKETIPDNGQRAGRGETRKVQLTGGSTLVVSLPSEWARSVGIKAKDEVYLAPQADMSLLITHKKENAKPSEAVIEVSPHPDENEVLRLFIAYYIAGYDVLRIRFKANLPDVRSKLKTHIRQKLIGVEIVEETSDAILTQCLHGYLDLPVNKALSRMGILASAMVLDAARALSTGDLTLANEIIDRDDEVDRFAHFIARELNLAVHNRAMIQEIGLSTAQECLHYRLMAKIIERIADHAVIVASSAISLDRKKIPQSLAERVQKLSKLSDELYESALRAAYGNSSKMANEIVPKLKHVLREEELATQELIATHLDNNAVVALRLALESLRRVGEYSVDICEIVVNLSVGSPL
jgi:phosphate uptake regulator